MPTLPPIKRVDANIQLRRWLLASADVGGRPNEWTILPEVASRGGDVRRMPDFKLRVLGRWRKGLVYLNFHGERGSGAGADA